MTRTIAGAAGAAAAIAVGKRWLRPTTKATAQESGAEAGPDDTTRVRFVVPAIASDGEGPVPGLPEMIGAMVIAGVGGSSVEAGGPIAGQLGARRTRRPHPLRPPGARNVVSPSGLAALTSEIQGLAPPS